MNYILLGLPLCCITCQNMILYYFCRYGLLVMDIWLVTTAAPKVWNLIAGLFRSGNHKEIRLFDFDLWRSLWNLMYFFVTFCVLDLALPILVFMALYGKSLLNLTDKGIQYFIAAAVIISSRRFMIAIAKFPAVGGKVYMLTRVLVSLYRI